MSDREDYIDYPVAPNECGWLFYGIGKALRPLSKAIDEAGYITCIYADGTGSVLLRKPAPNWNPALIPTHVRMKKGGE